MNVDARFQAEELAHGSSPPKLVLLAVAGRPIVKDSCPPFEAVAQIERGEGVEITMEGLRRRKVALGRRRLMKAVLRDPSQEKGRPSILTLLGAFLPRF